MQGSTIYYSSNIIIRGVQIDNTGCIQLEGQIVGGDMVDADFEFSVGDTITVGYSVSDSSVSVGEGVLIEFDESVNYDCITDIILSDQDATSIPYDFVNKIQPYATLEFDSALNVSSIYFDTNTDIYGFQI